MSDYRRSYVPGGTYFFTLVTANRRPVFSDPAAVDIFRNVYRRAAVQQPFRTIAAIVLPDHLHCLWTLPEHDADYSSRWKRIKRQTSVELKGAGWTLPLWQPRFWERTIRSEDDLHAYMNYIHYNPVKHGHVPRAIDWPASSLHRLIERGWYDADWGIAAEPEMPNSDMGEP